MSIERLKALFRMDIEAAAIASTTLAGALVMTTFGYYYVKVFLNVYKISTTWLNASQILYIIWNIANEPICGFLQDFGPHCMKSRKKVIAVGGIFFVASFLLPWFPFSRTSDSAIGAQLM